MFLFRISTKRSDVWSRKTPVPIYFVAQNSKDAWDWCAKNLEDGLMPSKIVCLAEQVGGVVFVGNK